MLDDVLASFPWNLNISVLLLINPSLSLMVSVGVKHHVYYLLFTSYNDYNCYYS